jgi:cytochrome c peroxidase
VPMFNHAPVELGLDQVLPERLQDLSADELLARLHQEAFPDADPEITLTQVVQAIASYVRTLISADSAFDRYLYWGEETMSTDAKRGMGLFFSERTNCSLCHASFNLSGPVRQQGVVDPRPAFHNTGLYNIPTPDWKRTHTRTPTRARSARRRCVTSQSPRRTCMTAASRRSPRWSRFTTRVDAT